VTVSFFVAIAANVAVSIATSHGHLRRSEIKSTGPASAGWKFFREAEFGDASLSSPGQRRQGKPGRGTPTRGSPMHRLLLGALCRRAPSPQFAIPSGVVITPVSRLAAPVARNDEYIELAQTPAPLTPSTISGWRVLGCAVPARPGRPGNLRATHGRVRQRKSLTPGQLLAILHQHRRTRAAYYRGAVPGDCGPTAPAITDLRRPSNFAGIQLPRRGQRAPGRRGGASPLRSGLPGGREPTGIPCTPTANARIPTRTRGGNQDTGQQTLPISAGPQATDPHASGRHPRSRPSTTASAFRNSTGSGHVVRPTAGKCVGNVPRDSSTQVIRQRLLHAGP
jgi:hypothetical protein